MADSREPEDARLIVIVGPTATGKSAAAVEVAERLGGEIISVDSMAVYRGMDIGTAKPSPADRARAPFHLLDVCEPDEAFTVARFKVLAEEAISEISARGKRPVLAGGTGLYARALLEGFRLTESAAVPGIRAALEAEAAKSGVARLHEQLAAADPEAARRIHPNDRVRLVRALEVIAVTGRTLSEQHAADAAARRPKPAVKFALTAARDELYRRIDARVDRMLAAGWEEEVMALMARGLDAALPALQSLGYKELVAFIRGEIDRDSAVHSIKQNTRRFAKRQLTWFRAEPDLTWIDVAGRTSAGIADEIAKAAREPGGRGAP